MPQACLQADATGLPVTRQTIEAQIDMLIDLLDTLDVDSDLEPSLGFSAGGCYPENQPQTADAGATDDREDEHDGGEPHEESEPSLGWTSTLNQTSPAWRGEHPFSAGADLEEGMGPIRKRRAPSRTGNRVMAGAGAF